MADIATESGLSADDSALAGASKLFVHLWHSAWEQEAGVLAGHGKNIHVMRVNLRRLRSALESFEGGKRHAVLTAHLRREIRDQRKDVVALADRLGVVRDYDVLLDYVSQYAETTLHDEIKSAPGLADLRHDLRKRRADAFGDLVKRVHRATKPGALDESFGRWALGLPAARGSHAKLTGVAKELLAVQITRVEDHAPALELGADPDAIHDFRKGLRRLRYTLEAFSLCYDQPVKPHLKVLVKCQDLLGEMQDRTVLEIATETAMGEDVPDDISAFLQYGSKRRRYLLGQMRRHWRRAQNEDFTARLRTLT